MLVENKWFSGAISLPLIVSTSLGVNVVSNSGLVSFIYWLIILGVAGISYQRIVVSRAKAGRNEAWLSVQWIIFQLIALGGVYWAISVIGGYT